MNSRGLWMLLGIQRVTQQEEEMINVRYWLIAVMLLCPFVVYSQELYQLHSGGEIWRYTGTPCSGNSCPGWQLLDNNSLTKSIAVGETTLNPPANSVSAAHGNTDWHIDTANEFLFGKNMVGQQTAQHHAPDIWTKSHIHVGLTNTSNYYYDKSRVNTGG